MRERRRVRQPLRKTMKPWQIYMAGGIVALLAVLFVIAIGAISRNTGAGFDETITVVSPRPGDIPQDARTFGDPDAPITIDEYLDFQCPACRRAAQEILPAIEEQYISTGKARLVVHPIAILGSESLQAASAVECAGDQGEFWLYYDMIFANQGTRNSGAFSESRLKAFAAEAGLDTVAFNSCLDAGTHLEAVQENTDLVRAAGIRAVPTFLVNGTPVGATLDDLLAALEAADRG